MHYAALKARHDIIQLVPAEDLLHFIVLAGVRLQSNHSAIRGAGQDHIHVHCYLYDVIQSRSTAFLCWGSLHCSFNAS